MLIPLIEMAHLLASIWATSTPGAMRRASGMLRTPERRISSPVITNAAAGASTSLSSVLDTEVTSICMSSSSLSSVRLELRGSAQAGVPVNVARIASESNETQTTFLMI